MSSEKPQVSTNSKAPEKYVMQIGDWYLATFVVCFLIVTIYFYYHVPKNAKQITVAIVEWLPHIRGILDWENRYNGQTVGIPNAFIRAICYVPMLIVGIFAFEFEAQYTKWRPNEELKFDIKFFTATGGLFSAIALFHWLSYWISPGKIALGHIIVACGMPFATGYFLIMYLRAIIYTLKK
jgi:hypothetical protein